jgi:hypothetical protein
MISKPNLIDIPTKSRKILFHFVNECNKYYRSGHDLKLYRDIITLHRTTKDINLLIKDEKFLHLLYDTLIEWDMDKRGAELNTFERFSKSIVSCGQEIKKLYRFKLQSISEPLRNELLRLLSSTFRFLDVMKTTRRIVGVSKTLHFLLPDLVMPIDGKFTMTYFYGYNKSPVGPEKEFGIFEDIFIRTEKIVGKLELTNDDLKEEGWNTSVPKLVDNSIIGFNDTLRKYYDQFGENGVNEFMALLGNLADFTSAERMNYRKLLEREKKSLDNSKREKIRKKILIQKATDAGITISEEEIEDELAREKNK